MFFNRKIKELLSRLHSSPKNDQNYIFPYSDNKDQRREEVWTNLQKGILFEDTLTFIPWDTPFNQLNRFKEQRRDSGDRTEWYFGKRTILDGYDCHAEAKIWMYLSWTNPMTEIYEIIGFDKDGERRFHELIEKFSDVLGEPQKHDIKKWNHLDLGEVNWVNGKVSVNLIGFEMHNARYRLNIGLVNDKNQDFLERSIEHLKATGFTEEELGK